MLNLFYEEPEGDRWFRYDRYPRRVIRRIVRGAPRPGGQKRVFLNLCAGLDKLRVRYRVNDYRFVTRNPHALACIIGKPFVLDKIAWENPILFGAAGYSHPVDDPFLLERLPVKKVLVPGPWYEAMCKPHWGAVQAWPVGIDMDRWQPVSKKEKQFDVLLYDKIMWDHDRVAPSIIGPIRATLRRHGRSFAEIRYGFYREEEFWGLLGRCRTMIFLCEHEGQGIAYQQALSCGVPILAWDRGGPWLDPHYYPHRVVYKPVSSVPYWDERCGMKFNDSSIFEATWQCFWESYKGRAFKPRDYILEQLTLDKCARTYLDIVESLGGRC